MKKFKRGLISTALHDVRHSKNDHRQRIDTFSNRQRPQIKKQTKKNRPAIVSFDKVSHINNYPQLTSLKFLNKGELDELPCMLSWMMVLANDFELPGLPTMKSGIRSSIQITIIKIFSQRASFFAMFSFTCKSSTNSRWQLLRYEFIKYYKILKKNT